MSTQPKTPTREQVLAATETAVPPAIRADLITSEQRFLSRTYTVFKNPISLAYFRLPKAHAKAARSFDGKSTFGAIADALKSEDPYWKALTREAAMLELRQLSEQMAMSGLVQVSGRGALARGRHIKTAKSKQKLEAWVGKILYIKKSLIDPDKVLNAMHPWVSWMYTPGAVAGCFALWTATALAMVYHWAELSEHAANFFTLQNIGLTWVLFMVIKTIHEFGHGLTCKHFGGEVHEMGFLLILFTPYLYCDVSDSWIMRDKKHRIYVTAAGIFVELILASVAAWLWLTLSPGLARQLCFNTIFICSVSTILFNANPLMKFDGYYMLTDMLEIPNLKQKSNNYVTAWAQKNILGMKNPLVRLATFEVNPWFGIYSVLSYFYAWLVMFRISTHMFDILEPYGLNFLSRTYVGLFLFTSLGLPCYRLVMSVSKTPAVWPIIQRRLSQAGIGLAVAVVFVFICPWNDSIKRSVVLEHSRIDLLSAAAPGFLREVFIEDGQEVKAGQPVARLENEELEAQQKDLALQCETFDVHYRAAISNPKEEIRMTATAYQKLRREGEAQLQRVTDQLDQMVLRAPRDGVVRSRRVEDMVGQYFSKGRVICEIGTRDQFRAVIALNEREARRVNLGQRVEMRLSSLGKHDWSGTIAVAPVSPLKTFSVPSLANMVGGDVPSDVGQDGHLRPTLPHYEAEVVILEQEDVLRSGMIGKARIYLGRTTLGLWICHRALDYIDPSIRI